MVFVLHLFWHRRRFEPFLRTRTGHFTVIGITIISFMIGIYAINHLPYIDFRPYKIGNSLPAEMVADESPKLEYTFEKDGEEIISEKYLLPEDGYKYISSRVVNEKASTPAITDYQVMGTDGNDYTQESFEGKRLLLIFYNTKNTDKEMMGEVVDLVNNLDTSISPMVLTSASEADFEVFRHEYQLAVPYYLTDATVLKAMIRSNPGVMVMDNGVVLGKWHYNDVPEAVEVNALLK